MTVEVRELWARGIIANAIEYRLGDMDLALTPYTVYLPERDGTVNTPEVFVPQQEIIDYEEFYTGFNERRLQGGRVDFGLAFDQAVEALDVRTFVARLRPTDFTDDADAPHRRRPRGTRQLSRSGRSAASGYSSACQPRQRRGTTSTPATPTRASATTSWSVDGALSRSSRPTAVGLAIAGEGGLVGRQAAPSESGDGVEPPTPIRCSARATRSSRSGLRGGPRRVRRLEAVGALVMNVGPDFFSVAAQSKRVDYTRSRSLFDRVGNDADPRQIGLFDLTRDPAIYTYRIEDRLMRYDPRYNNALPYGRATPNRRGIRLAAEYGPAGGPVAAEVLVALLREIRGQGTDELKDFALVRAAADVELSTLIGYDRGLGVTLGTQVENTSRGGEPIEAVDLTSVLLEAGVTAEVYDRLDLLLGFKGRASSGRDYVPQITNFNDVRDFPRAFVTDDGETLLGAGVRYRFGEDIFLTLQYQRFSYGADELVPGDGRSDDDFTIGQVFALYSMDF